MPHPVPKSPKGPHVCPYRHVVLQAVIRRTLCVFFTRGRCKIHQCCTVWCLVVDDADGVCVCIFFEGSCWWMFQIDRQLRQFCFWFRQKQSFCKFFVVDFPSPPQKKKRTYGAHQPIITCVYLPHSESFLVLRLTLEIPKIPMSKSPGYSLTGLVHPHGEGQLKGFLTLDNTAFETENDGSIFDFLTSTCLENPATLL